MTVTTEPVDAAQHEHVGKSGRTPGGTPGREKPADSHWLLPHPHNSPPNVPASVFFGTSGVPGDGCAAEELGAEDANACLNAGCATVDECLIRGCARVRLATALDCVSKNGSRNDGGGR
jgi:hypothetical protein